MSEDCLGSAAALYSQSEKRVKTCAFCKGDHWLDRCSVITDMEVRKILLRNHKRCFICLNRGHISQNSLKKNGCYFCKGLPNSTICSNRDKKEKPENTNVNLSSSEKDFVLLQTAEVNLINKSNCAEVKVKILFDSGSEKNYISRRAQNILNLAPLNSEKLKINTFDSTNSQVTAVERVNFFIKTADEKLIGTEAYTSPLTCLPL